MTLQVDMAYYYKIPQDETEDLSFPRSIQVFKGKKSPTDPSIKLDFSKHVLIELLDDVTPEKELWEALGVAKNKKVVHKRMMIDSHRTNCRRAVVVCTSSDEAKLLAKQLSQATIRNRCICAIVIHELLSDMCLFEKQVRQHGDTRPQHQLLYISDLNQSLSPAKLASFLKEKFHSLGTVLSVFVSDKKDGFAAPEGVIKFAFLSEAYAAELAYDQSVLGMQRISVTVNQNILLAQCDLKARLRETVFKHTNDSFHIPFNEASVVGLPTNLDNISCSSFRTAVSSSSNAFDSAEKSTLQQDSPENASEFLKNVNSFIVSSEMNGDSSSKSLHPHSSLGSVRQYSIVSSSADDQEVMEEVPEDVHPSLKSAAVERLYSVPTWSSRVDEWISELPPVEGGLFSTPQLKSELLENIYKNGKEQDMIIEANPSSPPASVASSFATCKETVADFNSISSRHSDITSTNLSFVTCKDALNESFSDSNSVSTVWEDDTELDNTIIPLEDEDIDITVPLCERIRAHSSQKVSPKKKNLRFREETEDGDIVDATMPMNGARKQKSNFSYSEELSSKQLYKARNIPASDSLVISNSMDITVPLKGRLQPNDLKSWEDVNTGDSMDMTVPLNGALQTESFKCGSVYNTRDSVSLSELTAPVNNHDSTSNSSVSTKEKRDFLLPGKFSLKGEKSNHSLETQNFCNPHIATCYLSDLKVVLKNDPVLNAIAKDFSASDPPVIKLDNIGTSENSVQDASTECREEIVNMVKPKIPVHCESNQASDSVDVTIPLHSALQTQCFKSCSVKKTNDSAYLSKSSVPSYDHNSTLNSSVSSKGEKNPFLTPKLSLKEEKVNDFMETQHFCNPHIASCYMSELRVVLKNDPELDAIAKRFSASDPPVIKLGSITLSSENCVQDASMGCEEETINMIKQKTPVHHQSSQASDSGHVTVPLTGVLQTQCFKSSFENTSDSVNFSKSAVPSYDHDSTLNSSISSKRSGSLLSQKLSLKRQKVSHSQENRQLVNPPIPTSCLSDLWVVLNTDPELDAIAKQLPVVDPLVFKLNASYKNGVHREEKGNTEKEKVGKFKTLPYSTDQKTTSSESSSRAGSVLRRSTRLASRNYKKSLDKSISHGEKDKSQLRIWLKEVLSLSTNNTLFSCQEGTKSIVCATMNKDVLISVGCSHMTCDVCYPGSINLLLGYT